MPIEVLRFINIGNKLLKATKIQCSNEEYLFVRCQDENVYKIRKTDFDDGMLVIKAIK